MQGARARTHPAPRAPRMLHLVSPPPWRLSPRALDGLQAAHIALQHLWHRDRAALLLVRLHDGDERAADGNAGAVERVHVAHLASALGAVARLHAPRLKLAAERAGGNLA